MNIGQASNASGVSAKMIRYYESIGLISEAERSASGYRHYQEADVHTLRFIGRARDLGFSVDQISELLALWRDRSRASAQVKDLALRHVAGLRRKIAELQAMARTLSTLAEHCEGDHRPDCPILDEFAGRKKAQLAPDTVRKLDHRFGAGAVRGAKRSKAKLSANNLRSI